MIKIPIPDIEKIPIDGIEQYKGFEAINKMYIEAVVNTNNQIEAEIKKRIAALGIYINDIESLKGKFQFVERKGDEYKHLFYLPEMKCIISIQKTPAIKMDYDGEDFKNNQVTVICDYKYY